MYLTKDEDWLRRVHAFATAKEITQQPQTWLKTARLIQAQQINIHAFLDSIDPNRDFDIVLIGAGTSEYIGNVLESALGKANRFRIRSVPTTDMILDPKRHLNDQRKTLIVSFARSGNSPESVGAVHAVDSVSDQAYHLFITCNRNGKLARTRPSQNHSLLIVLPDETHDEGFAMTSSFTNMIIAATLILKIENIETELDQVQQLAQSVEHSLEGIASFTNEIIKSFKFQRIIYLGSNEFHEYAQESALKVLELTAGAIATQYESPLGFRHGPKSFINDETLIVIFLNDEPMVRQYEMDLIYELRKQKRGDRLLIVSHDPLNEKNEDVLGLSFTPHLSSIYVGLKMMVVAHCLAFFKSIQLDIPTDNPCPTGEVNRVVTGVTIYPVEPERSRISNEESHKE